MYVYVCSGITRRFKLWRALKVDAVLSLISFSLKLILGLRFYDDLNFFKPSVTALDLTNFKGSNLFFTKRSMFKGVWDCA